jgi:hypothetical protein
MTTTAPATAEVAVCGKEDSFGINPPDESSVAQSRNRAQPGRGKPHTMKSRRYTMEPIITKHSGNWTSGHIGPFRFEIKHFDEPSVFGIDEGRISKLWLGWAHSYGTVAAFDRGWDKLPGFEEAQEAVDTLCTLWN